MKRCFLIVLALWSAGAAAVPAFAQGMGSSGTVTGTVTDPSGAILPGASVDIQNKVTGYEKTTTTDPTGMFKFLGVPQNNYHMTVTAQGFQPHVEDVIVRTTVAVNLNIAMALATSTTSVDVHGDTDLIESVPTAHVDVD